MTANTNRKFEIWVDKNIRVEVEKKNANRAKGNLWCFSYRYNFVPKGVPYFLNTTVVKNEQGNIADVYHKPTDTSPYLVYIRAQHTHPHLKRSIP